MAYENIAKRAGRNRGRNSEPVSIPQSGWRGVNYADSPYEMQPYHLPFAQNVDLGNPIGDISKVLGREALFTSLGSGKILGQKIWRHPDGDKFIFAWNKGLYLLSGDAGSIAKTSQADWEAGTCSDELDTTTSAGDMKCKKPGTDFSETDTLTADFNGTHSNTQATANSVQLTLNSGAKFYVTADAAGYDPATERGAWDHVHNYGAYKMSKTKSGSITYNMHQETGGTGYDVILAKFVSDGLPSAKTISGTMGWCLGVKEDGINANFYYHVHAFVTVGDSDTVRGTLLTDYIGSTEWDYTAKGLQVSGQALSSVVAQAGDRIVIEVGFRALNTDDDYYGYLYTGGTSSTDLTNGGDPTLYPGWFQFSDDPFATTYNTTGIYTHPAQDISGAELAGPATISYNATTPAGTAVAMQTRYTTDGSTWTSWTTRSSGDTIIPAGTDLSNAASGVQWRTPLTSTTGASTPSLDDVTVAVNAGYETEATWISPVCDLGNTPMTATLSWTVTEPAGTSVTWYAAGSNDGVVFGDWREVSASGGSIPLLRYIKIKAVLSGTVSATPTVSDLLISYSFSYTKPNLLDISPLGRTGNELTGSRVSMEEYDDRLYCADGLRSFCLYVDDNTEATGTAQASATTYITLAAGASAVNDFYNNAFVTLTGGTGAGQVRFISDYNGTNKRATPSVNFNPAPDATTTYSISAAVKARNAGVDAPASACSAAAGAAGSLTGTYYYKFTYVNRDGYESNPSPASGAVSLSSQQGSLTGVLVGDGTITSRKVYRTKAGGSVYYYVGTISNNTTTTYTDNTADSALTVLMYDNNNVPPYATIVYPFLTYLFYVNAEELWFSKAGEGEAVCNITGDINLIVCPGRILDIKSNPMALIPQGEFFAAPITSNSGFIFDSDPEVDTTTMRVIDRSGSLSYWASDMCITPDLRSVLVSFTRSGIRTFLPGLQEQSIESIPLSRNVQPYFDRAVNRENSAGIFHDGRYLVAFEYLAPGAAESVRVMFACDFRQDSREWSGPWLRGASCFAVGGNVLYSGDPENGIIYREFTGSSNAGAAIEMIADLPQLSKGGENRTYKYLNVMAVVSSDSDTTNTLIKPKVDSREATIAVGALTDTFTGDVRPGHNSLRTKKYRIPLPRGNTCSHRIYDNSTNPVSIQEVITEVEPLRLKK